MVDNAKSRILKEVSKPKMGRKNYHIDKLEASLFGRLTKTGVELSGGSRPRLYLTDSRSKRKIFVKTYSHNPNEIYSEFLASKIAKSIGLSAQDAKIVELPQTVAQWMREESSKRLRDEWIPIGVSIDNIFPDGTEVMYAKDILGNPERSLSLEVIESGLRKRFGDAEDIIQSYADMVVFDALIGNMDRHHENWGVVVIGDYKSGLAGQIENWDPDQHKNQRYFTPLFDHGSSLMFELQENKLERMVQDIDVVERYVSKGYGFILSIHKTKANIFKVLHQYMHSSDVWNHRFKISINKVLSKGLGEYADIINKMPVSSEYGWTDLRKNALIMAMHLRYNRLVELLKLEAVEAS